MDYTWKANLWTEKLVTAEINAYSAAKSPKRPGEKFLNQLQRVLAPKARNMIARGKRAARRPWFMQIRAIRPEGPKYCALWMGGI